VPTRSLSGGASLVAGLLLGGLGPGVTAGAEELGEVALRQIRAIYADKATWTEAQSKLDTSLLYASRKSQGLAMVQGMTTDQDIALVRGVASRAGVGSDGMVVVDIEAKVTDGLILAIAGAGGRVMSAFPAFDAVRARIPVRRVEEIAALDEVRHVGPRQEFLLNTGSATSEGDGAHRAAAARAASGLDGTGIKVGVLSDGVDDLGKRQTSLDLPPTCATPPGPGACVKIVQECNPIQLPPGKDTCGAEGTALMEIIHDLAPGAQLYFATAMDGPAAFAQNILDLKDVYGCDIIVDDVTYLDEGAFQDGVIAQAVTAVKNAGTLYFSAAGNSGRKDAGTSGTWEGDFVDSRRTIGIPALGYPARPMHSFNGLTGASAETSDQLTYFSSIITLKWSDPLGASPNDYDLFRTDSAFTSVLDLSINRQTGVGDPIEGVPDGNPGDRMVVALYDGTIRALRLDTNRGRLSISTAGAVVGHSSGEGSVSVAAIMSTAGNAFTGGTTNPVEVYSSDGPRRMFYNPNGTAITPGNVLFAGGGRDLKKPDVTAADCVTTASPSMAFNPFCGTSAAAPHAAAVAALLKSAPNHPGSGQVLSAMMTTALDVLPGAGWDRNSGVGIVMADSSLTALTTLPALGFYTVSPCRVVDTRQTGGALSCGTERLVTMVGGSCGVPTDAKAVSINLTTTGSSGAGNVRLYAAGSPSPLVSTLNYVAGMSRANNAVAPLNASGQMAVLCSPSGTTHVIVDVNGYFK
jgi:hypothetical protein